MENVLWELFVVFALARVAGEILVRLRFPSVVGELLVGVAIGPHALGLVHGGEVLEAIAEMGVVFLLFEVGLENRFSDLRAVGGTAAGVAVSGVAVPFVSGVALMAILGHDSATALFMGAAMVATSVGVTARVLTELGQVRAASSKTILGAAVIDDVLGLLVLAVVTGIAGDGLSPARIGLLAGEAAFFLAFVALFLTRLVRRHGLLLERLHLHNGPFAFSVVVCLGFSALAGQIGLAAIIGAFLAGMALAETKERFELERSIEPVTNLLTPFFFVLTGMAVEPAALTEPGTIALVGLVCAVAIVTKLGPCRVAARKLGGRDALIVGVGMVPRGEVGIIVASVGLASGVIARDVYAAVVAMSVLTTLVVPPALRTLFARQA